MVDGTDGGEVGRQGRGTWRTAVGVWGATLGGLCTDRSSCFFFGRSAVTRELVLFQCGENRGNRGLQKLNRNTLFDNLGGTLFDASPLSCAGIIYTCAICIVPPLTVCKRHSKAEKCPLARCPRAPVRSVYAQEPRLRPLAINQGNVSRRERRK